jgi:hypothetical protein
MTIQTETKFWSNIDDSQAESLSGGYTYTFKFGDELVTIESATLIPSLGSPLLPAGSAPTFLPVEGVSITYRPNPIPGGPLVQITTPIVSKPKDLTLMKK